MAKKRFQSWARLKGQKEAASLIDADWDRMVTFYRHPKEHWRHLRTSNIVESPFATLRLRTDAAKRFQKVDNATAVVWKMLHVVEKSFRKLNAPQLMALIYAGAKCNDGVIIREDAKGMAA